MRSAFGMGSGWLTASSPSCSPCLGKTHIRDQPSTQFPHGSSPSHDYAPNLAGRVESCVWEDPAFSVRSLGTRRAAEEHHLQEDFWEMDLIKSRCDGQVRWWSRTMAAAFLSAWRREEFSQWDGISGPKEKSSSNAGGVETICEHTNFPVRYQTFISSLQKGKCVCLGEERWKVWSPLPTERGQEGNGRLKEEFRGMLMVF